jgi:hypothetical protein
VVQFACGNPMVFIHPFVPLILTLKLVSLLNKAFLVLGLSNNTNIKLKGTQGTTVCQFNTQYDLGEIAPL